jgi:UDP-N-acetylmuramoyl-tripeptide--D-alanyl-D-alanine ligase
MLKIRELLKATEGSLANRADAILIKGISIDSRTLQPGDAFIAITGSNFDGHDFIDEAIKKGATAVIVQSSLAARLPDGQGQAGNFKVQSEKKVAIIKVKDTIRALGDIARFLRKKFNTPVIAVTGSNGKTTTKEMISHVLSLKFKVLKNEGTKNNQIGLPLTLCKLDASYDIGVLEIGTNHPGEIEYLSSICLPNIGVITNIGHSHLEYLRDLRGVFTEKYSMMENLEKPFIGILNADDNLLKRKISSDSGRDFVLSFGMESRCDFLASLIKNDIEGIEFCVNKKYRFTLNTLGYYNIYNALAAISAARIFGIEYPDIITSLNNFIFPESRLKFLEIGAISFIDDTYNSNPLSLSHALDTLANLRVEGRKIFVMGDMLELGSQEKLFHYKAGKKAASCCDIFITVGKLSGHAAKAAKDCRFETGNIFACGNIEEARKILFDDLSLKKGDIVLVKGSRSMKMERILKI